MNTGSPGERPRRRRSTLPTTSSSARRAAPSARAPRGRHLAAHALDRGADAGLRPSGQRLALLALGLRLRLRLRRASPAALRLGGLALRDVLAGGRLLLGLVLPAQLGELRVERVAVLLGRARPAPPLRPASAPAPTVAGRRPWPRAAPLSPPCPAAASAGPHRRRRSRRSRPRSAGLPSDGLVPGGRGGSLGALRGGRVRRGRGRRSDAEGGDRGGGAASAARGRGSAAARPGSAAASAGAAPARGAAARRGTAPCGRRLGRLGSARRGSAALGGGRRLGGSWARPASSGAGAASGVDGRRAPRSAGGPGPGRARPAPRRDAPPAPDRRGLLHRRRLGASRRRRVLGGAAARRPGPTRSAGRRAAPRRSAPRRAAPARRRPSGAGRALVTGSAALVGASGSPSARPTAGRPPPGCAPVAAGASPADGSSPAVAVGTGRGARPQRRLRWGAGDARSWITWAVGPPVEARRRGRRGRAAGRAGSDDDTTPSLAWPGRHNARMDPYAVLGVDPTRRVVTSPPPTAGWPRSGTPTGAPGRGGRPPHGGDQRGLRPAPRRGLDRPPRSAAARPRPRPRRAAARARGSPRPSGARSGRELLGALEPQEDVWLVTPATTWASPQALLAASDRRLLWLLDDIVTGRVQTLRYAAVTDVEHWLHRPRRRVATLRVRAPGGRRHDFGELRPGTAHRSRAASPRPGSAAPRLTGARAAQAARRRGYGRRMERVGLVVHPRRELDERPRTVRRVGAGARRRGRAGAHARLRARGRAAGAAGGLRPGHRAGRRRHRARRAPRRRARAAPGARRRLRQPRRPHRRHGGPTSATRSSASPRATGAAPRCPRSSSSRTAASRSRRPSTTSCVVRRGAGQVTRLGARRRRAVRALRRRRAGRRDAARLERVHARRGRAGRRARRRRHGRHAARARTAAAARRWSTGPGQPASSSSVEPGHGGARMEGDGQPAIELERIAAAALHRHPAAASTPSS